MVVSTSSRRGPMTAPSVVKGSLTVNGIEATSDGRRTSHVVAAEEVQQRIAPSAFGSVERRPALEKPSEHRRVFVAEPVEDLGKVASQRAGESVGDGDAIVGQGSSNLHQPSEGAHIGTLGLKARQLLG